MSRRRCLLAVLLTALFASSLAESAAAQDPTLTVSRTGGGTVTSTPAGINCGSDCTEAYAVGSTRVCEYDPETGQNLCFYEPAYQDVTLTASTPTGWSFKGWGGACTGTAQCVVTMDDDYSVSATWSDVQNPTVALTSPTQSAVTGTITVSANAQDNDRVASVQFFVGASPIGTDTTAPYSVNLNTASVGDGMREIRAVAMDPSGRTASATKSVMVDNTNPALTFTSGPDGQTFGPGGTQSWTFTAGDAHSGVKSVQCKVQRSGAAAAAYGPCSGGNSSHAVSGLPGGTYTLSVRVTDNVNRSVEATRTFAIDATAPSTSIAEGPADGSSTTSTTLAFAFAASEAATFQCRVYPAALTPPAFGACSEAARHVASGFSPGTYTFEVRAIDALGNVGTPVKRTFTVAAPTTDAGSGGAGSGESAGTTGGLANPVAAPSTVLFRPLVVHRYRMSRGKTTFSVLRLDGAPSGSKVRLTCKGRGCPLRSRRFTIKARSTNLLGALRRKALRAGLTLEIRITAPSGDVRVIKYATRRGKAPRRIVRCAAPGGRLGTCSS